MSDVIYTPPASLKGFLTSEKPIALIVGPVGSGKSSASMMKIAYHAKRMRKQADGIRRSRAVVVRNTRQMLTDATIPTFETWFPRDVAGAFLKTDGRFLLRFDDVECDVLFRGLDDPSDVRRLLSLEVSFGVMDEFRELPMDIFNALQARVGRYPSKKDGGCVGEDGKPNWHVWGATNPPDADTDWEELLSDPPDTADVFFQPSGLSPEADWIEYLPDGYYETLAEGKSDDYIDVYIHAKFGRSLSGQPVFRSFDYNTHVAKSPLRPNGISSSPLIIGQDFGLTPACTISQIAPDGRLLTFREITSEGMGALRFVREKLKPLLASQFPNMTCVVIGDPAGVQRSQTDERSVFEIFRAEGFKIIPARSNAIPARIAAVDHWLTRTVGGKPAHLIDPSCTTLIQGLRGKYRYKVKTSGERDDKPEKNSFSHIADAHQYACLHADGGQMFGKAVPGHREVRKVAYAY